MQVSVVRLWVNGKLVPRWQLAQLKPTIGDLSLKESRDEHLNRFQRSAHLFDSTGAINQRKGELIPPLIDAAVLWIRDRRMTISGFERDEMSSVTYAQTWLIEVISQEEFLE